MPWCDGDRFSNAAEPHVNTAILNAKLMHWLVETARRHYKNPTPATKGIKQIQSLIGCPNHRIPESLRALLRIVSLTAANTSRMFEVSVACVK